MANGNSVLQLQWIERPPPRKTSAGTDRECVDASTVQGRDVPAEYSDGNASCVWSEGLR